MMIRTVRKLANKKILRDKENARIAGFHGIALFGYLTIPLCICNISLYYHFQKQQKLLLKEIKEIISKI